MKRKDCWQAFAPICSRTIASPSVPAGRRKGAARAPGGSAICVTVTLRRAAARPLARETTIGDYVTVGVHTGNGPLTDDVRRDADDGRGRGCAHHRAGVDADELPAALERMERIMELGRVNGAVRAPLD